MGKGCWQFCSWDSFSPGPGSLGTVTRWGGRCRQRGSLYHGPPATPLPPTTPTQDGGVRILAMGRAGNPGYAKTRRGKETRMSPRPPVCPLTAMPFSGCRWRGLGGPTPGCDSGGFAVHSTADLESPREKREKDWLDWAENKLQVEDQTGQPAICHLWPSRLTH